MNKLSKILLTISFGVFFLIYALGAPMHLMEDWHPHALNHHLRSVISSATLAMVGIILIYISENKKWVWWTLTLIFLASGGGFWLAYGTLEFGLDDERLPAVIAGTIQVITGLPALLLARKDYK